MNDTNSISQASTDDNGQSNNGSPLSKSAPTPEGPESEPKAKTTTSTPKRHRHRKHRFPWITAFALLLVMVLGAGNYWLYRQGEALQQTVSRLGSLHSNTEQQLSEIKNEIESTQEQQRESNQNIQHNEASQQSLLESMNRMSEQMKALASAKGKDPLFWRASEVEYLLSVANHSLLLARNVDTAKTALQDADKRLKQIGDPGLIPVRNKISQEINMLNSLSMPDIAGIAAQLNSLSTNLSQLPFIKSEYEQKPLTEQQNKSGFTGFGNAFKQLWHDVASGLFQIQRTDKPVEPLLPPDEKQYLLHNLKLKLEQARIALLQRQSQMFQNNLLEIEQWVKQYFDQESPAVEELLKSVQSYHATDLNPNLPDISGSLRELHVWMERQKNVAYDMAPDKHTNLVRL